MPVATSTPSAIPPPVSTPVVSVPKVTPPAAYEVVCVELDSVEKAVSVQEPEGVHACVRRVYYARLELDPKPLTQPAMSIKVESLEPLPFEMKKSYLVSFQPV